MYALCIIDLQEGFDGANSVNLHKPVIREIDLAKKRSYPIRIVEYNGFGDTEPWVMAAIGSYSKVKRIVKKIDDGSGAIRKSTLGATSYRICGINTDACIMKTVAGFLKRGIVVEVVKDGCWSGWDSNRANHPANHQRGILAIKRGGAKIISIGD